MHTCRARTIKGVQDCAGVQGWLGDMLPLEPLQAALQASHAQPGTEKGPDEEQPGTEEPGDCMPEVRLHARGYNGTL